MGDKQTEVMEMVLSVSSEKEGLRPYFGTQRRVSFLQPPALTSQPSPAHPVHTHVLFYLTLPVCLSDPGDNLESVFRAGMSPNCTIPAWVGPVWLLILTSISSLGSLSPLL